MKLNNLLRTNIKYEDTIQNMNLNKYIAIAWPYNMKIDFQTKYIVDDIFRININYCVKHF